jgi:hypothetical protein
VRDINQKHLQEGLKRVTVMSKMGKKITKGLKEFTESLQDGEIPYRVTKLVRNEDGSIKRVTRHKDGSIEVKNAKEDKGLRPGE